MQLHPTNDQETQRIQPPNNFMQKFLSLDASEKEIVLTGLYRSVKFCPLDANRRMIDGKPGRYADIKNNPKQINISILLEPEGIIRTDEQILLGVDQYNRDFDVIKHIHQLRHSILMPIFEIYLDASRIDKLAILKYLESLVSALPTRQASEQVSILFGNQIPYSKF